MLQIKTLPVGMLKANCYLLWEDSSMEGYVVDPGGEAEVILNTIRDLKLRVCAVLLTHGHDDHCASAKKVKNALGVPLWMHEKDVPMLSDAQKRAAFFGGEAVCEPPERLLFENDVLPFGDLKLKVIEVPGHSMGGLSFYTEGAVFTGDSLFFGQIGRCDLYGGDFDTLIKNLREKILTLPEDTEVYPGHGPSTTVRYEKQHNPYVGGTFC